MRLRCPGSWRRGLVRGVGCGDAVSEGGLVLELNWLNLSWLDLG